MKQIIGSFGDIGSEIISETVKLPGDIAAKALESAGALNAGNQKQQNTSSPGSGEKALGKVADAKDEHAKKLMARRALEELVGTGERTEKQSVWEEKQAEAQHHKQIMEKENKEQEKKKLKPITTVPRKGNLYGIRDKSSSERSKNVRAE